MNKLISLIAVSMLLAACASKPFVVKETDQFAGADAPRTVTSENNRVSAKPIAGRSQDDDKGVFIDPFVSKERATGRILALGLNITNRIDPDRNARGASQLGLIQEVMLRVDSGQTFRLAPVSAELLRSGRDGAGTAGRGGAYDVSESATVTLSAPELEQIAMAKSIACRIVGTQRSVTYEPDDIESSFLKNIRRFYEAHVR